MIIVGVILIIVGICLLCNIDEPDALFTVLNAVWYLLIIGLGIAMIRSHFTEDD